MTKPKKRITDFWRVAVVICMIAPFTAPAYASCPSVEPDTLRSNISFAIDTLCIVSDPGRSLDSFFAELDLLDTGKDTVINIVHLGDSHVQAGFFSGRMMRLMQSRFGNAGRGWISPLKIARTNEPTDYFITSLVKEWTSGRLIQKVPQCPVGPGGMGIRTESPFVNFDIIIAPNNGAGYQFDQVVQYRGEKAMPMLPGGTIKDSVGIFRPDTAFLPGIVADTFRISFLTDSLQLQSTRRKTGTNTLLPAGNFDNLYYGFNLVNGKAGILYHSIGLNGAMFVNYTDADYVRRLAVFNPSLLIVSLGTNETFGKNFSIDEFTGQVEDFMYLVRKYLPETAVLLTTPPECYKRVWVNKKRTYVRNNQTEKAANAIVHVAGKQGIACWDMFTATGGKNSSKKWFDGKFMGRDRIHFNKEGYQEQGTLLFKALLKLKIEREKEISLQTDKMNKIE